MASVESDIRKVEVADEELWRDGPPHAVFKEMRGQCPVHWTQQIPEFPTEDGFWSVTTADDVHAVSRDFPTYFSELGGITAARGFPLEPTRALFIGMDPPKHDRVKALFQVGFTPKRIAEHEERIREITREVLARLESPPARETCDLGNDVAQPEGARGIGGFMATPPEEDATRADLTKG